MILLDTNALLWLEREHPRSACLQRYEGSLVVSPASLLEIKFLAECGRIKFARSMTIVNLVQDSRWLVDDPPALNWFQSATDVEWTRDPFDRLLVAHASLRRWRLATGDTHIIEHLRASQILEL
ncbi:MAG: PIN domain-containing protein [Myxococcales bacterium]|nr:PIN domain-containing protein [Myxococcales bacterium]